jgi:hypothetical protein
MLAVRQLRVATFQELAGISKRLFTGVLLVWSMVLELINEMKREGLVVKPEKGFSIETQ